MSFVVSIVADVLVVVVGAAVVEAVVERRRRPVLTMRRSIRRCVVWSLLAVVLVVVQLAHPYRTVGVMAELKRWIRNRSGYRVLVNSSRRALNLRQATVIRLSISVVW